MAGSYCLPEGYRENPPNSRDLEHYVRKNREPSKFQSNVYALAGKMIKKLGLKSVLDVGCGVPEKLKIFILPHTDDITGLELDVDDFKENYKFGNWQAFDIERGDIDLRRSYDMIISADVIEHLSDPDRLLNFIKRNCHPRTVIVLSTPERDTLNVPKLGPPRLSEHLREWNQAEFSAYISSRGLNIILSMTVDEPAGGYQTQVCVCELPSPESRKTP